MLLLFLRLNDGMSVGGSTVAISSKNINSVVVGDDGDGAGVVIVVRGSVDDIKASLVLTVVVVVIGCIVVGCVIVVVALFQ